MKQILILLISCFIIIGAEAQKAMSNHTDARVPPARPVRPLHADNMDKRKVPVIRIAHDNAEELTISKDIDVDSYSTNETASLLLSDRGSYRISKGDQAIDLFYNVSKEINLDKKARSLTEISSSDSIQLDGKIFVCGIDNLDAELKKFSGQKNDEMGYYLNIPSEQQAWTISNTDEESSFKIISTSEDLATIRFNKLSNSKNEQKNIEGLMIVDTSSGLILSKNLRVSRIGSMMVKGKKFNYENHSSLQLELK